ncbi:restriction endonuclease subunit S [Aeromonas caviae]|uniref:restriction endonuclease subunit S n=1 Tax=Aeromonas caviae TaxID=648 RepID=UPI002B473F5D|nr:restriction endonuclease subunit S [Aeromonas caviae]
MTASAIPETWFHITLGDVVRVSSGMGFPQKYQGKQEGIYPVYKVGDISNAVINHKGNAFLAGNYVGESEAKELKSEVFSEGVTLFAKVGEAIKLNRRAFVTRAGLADNNVMAVIPEKLISKRFIYHFMHTVDLTDASRSTTVPSIRKGDIECLPLNIPSQAEQKEIASRLDKLLAQVASTQAHLARIPDIIKQFRQSVLAAAVSGKLTEEWRAEQCISLDEWELTDIGALAEVSTGKTPPRNNIDYWENGSIPWLTSAATGEPFTYEATQFVTEQAVKECTLKIFPKGTLLLAMYGEGKTRGQVTEVKISATCNQACAAILVNTSRVSLEFLKLKIQENYEETRKAAVGGAQPNLNLSKVREIPVSLPNCREQTEIVRRVEQLFAYADTIEQQTKAAKERVDKLTQAILAKAFRGELTLEWRAANPELISGDNSAAALLARIQAERAAATPRKRAGRQGS